MCNQCAICSIIFTFWQQDTCEEHGEGFAHSGWKAAQDVWVISLVESTRGNVRLHLSHYFKPIKLIVSSVPGSPSVLVGKLGGLAGAPHKIGVRIPSFEKNWTHPCWLSWDELSEKLRFLQKKLVPNTTSDTKLTAVWQWIRRQTWERQYQLSKKSRHHIAVLVQ